MMAWNSRRIIGNNYLTLVGISLLFIGGIDLLHMLAYKGMGVFPGQGANQATQLWIIARFLQALSFLAAPFLFDRKIRFGWLCAGYAAVTAILVASVFHWKNFPACFVEGVGLTGFKRVSEYVISGIFLASGGMLLVRRDKFEKDVLDLLVLSIVLMIAAELSFTFYVSVYGLSNLIGHFFKILSFLLVYMAIVETGFSKPYGLIFREMKKNEEALLRSKEELELRVQERTAELDRANKMLREEGLERKRAFDTLRESEEKFHLLFTEMVSGFALHEILCDPQGKPCDYRFLEVNPAFEKMTGLRREEILWKTVHEVFPGTDERLIRIYGDVALSGNPAHFEEYTAALKKHFEVLAYSPKQGQFAVSFTDITEKEEVKERLEKIIRIESALRRIEEKILAGADFQEALEIACDAVVEMGYRMCWVGLAEPDHSGHPGRQGVAYRGIIDMVQHDGQHPCLNLFPNPVVWP
jgi:PAS domain S-box-containing protein